jgi:hypothetical protein
VCVRGGAGGLAMTVEKRTLVDHLTHFRGDFGLPNRLHALLVRHPELFYVSIKFGEECRPLIAQMHSSQLFTVARSISA